MGRAILLLTLCAYESCGKEFEKKTHNQKYCDSDCCRKATNERIMLRYYEKRDNRRGKKRVCSHKDCNIPLSRYNEEDVCSNHSRRMAPRRDEVLRLLGKDGDKKSH